MPLLRSDADAGPVRDAGGMRDSANHSDGAHAGDTASPEDAASPTDAAHAGDAHVVADAAVAADTSARPDAASPVDAASAPDVGLAGDASVPHDASDPADATPGVDRSPPGCDQLYGMAPGYELCIERQDECEFLANTEGSCTATCARYGGSCLAAYDELNHSCTTVNLHDCATERFVQICVCTRQTTCDQIFGHLPGYQLCDQTPSHCGFMTTRALASCTEMCAAADSTCIESYDDQAVDCVRAAAIDCASTAHETFICECTRG